MRPPRFILIAMVFYAGQTHFAQSIVLEENVQSLLPKTKCGSQENCEKQELQEEECPENQTLKDCGLCGRSCKDYYLNIMFKCKCQPGCACNEGYIRRKNEEGECIKPEDCREEDTRCQDTQHFSASEIQRTCDQPSGNGLKKAGCFCNEGLVYDEASRTCVEANNCPKAICGTRQSYHKCFRNLVRTCNESQSTIIQDVESLECRVGCFCDDPFLWDEETQTCNHLLECPDSEPNKLCRMTDPKSEFRVCQSSTVPTCSSPKPSVLVKDCRNDCRCKPGFVFHEDLKKCMTLEECAQIGVSKSVKGCDANSTFKACANACPRTCANAYIFPGASPTCMACFEGCQCRAGYLRTRDKRCVLLKDCPEEEINCPLNREYKSCEYTIKTCDMGDTIKEDTCLRGCFCKAPMVQSALGRCINPSNCSLFSRRLL